MPQIIFEDLGVVEYKKAWDYQTTLFEHSVNLKLQARKEEVLEEQIPNNYLLFCEHPHVYTLGKSGSIENLVYDEAQLKKREIAFFRNNRGGDITYHGPGQIVGYPILDLDQFFTDVHLYMRTMEEAIIKTIADYGVVGDRLKGATGVWLDVVDPKKVRKICAMGVKMSRWVTMHGFAFNVNTDLSLFEGIIPCGIDDKAVTSLQKEVGKPMDMDEVKNKLKCYFAQEFEATYANE